MATESIRRRIDEAGLALRNGDADGALAAADDIIRADPASPEGRQLRGIALTRLNDLKGATAAFRESVRLAPEEPKHLYNLAVNLRDRKQKEEALRVVDQALQLDPAHPGARQLRAELTGEPVAAAGTIEPRAVEARAVEVRGGYGQPKHLLPFLAGMEMAWSAIGYTFLAADAVLAVLMIVHRPMAPTGLLMPHSKLPDIGLRHDRLSIFIVFLYIATWVCTFMWMFVDIIDLRKRFSWMVPFLGCSVLGFTVLPFALYVTLGRRTE